MRQLLIFVILLFLSACKKNAETDLLYNQLVNYRNDLKSIAKEQEINARLTVPRYHNLLKKRLDSLMIVDKEFQKSFEKLQYEERKPILALRDEFNIKHDLNLKFYSSTYYENISDSLFNILTETDILRLRTKFQSKYMFERGCQMN